MDTDRLAPAETASDASWRQIEDLVGDLAEMAASDISPSQFHAALVERSVTALAATAGALWMRAAGQELRLEYQVNLAATSLQGPEAEQRHAELLVQVIASGEPRLAPPHSGRGFGGGNPTASLLVLVPIRGDDQALGVLEVFQRPQSDPAVQQGYLEFLTDLASLATDYHRRQQSRELRSRELAWAQLDQVSQKLHGTLETRMAAYLIANEGRRFLGCDRVSVAKFVRRRARVAAVSGVDVLDSRANVVRRLEELLEAVRSGNETAWWFPVEGAELPPQLEVPLDAYLDESHARSLGVTLLFAAEADGAQARQPLGALVVERFDGPRRDPGLESRCASLARHAALALQNAQTHEGLPLLPLMRWLGSVTRGRNLSRGAILAVVLCAIVAVLVATPARFQLEAGGVLQPQVRRDVFAPTDGIVRELKVQHADPVSVDDVVAVLQKPQLEFEFSRVAGEIQTARKRLAAVEASRFSREGAAERANELSGEEEEIRELLTSLQAQDKILRDQQAELEVRSPIQGQVLTWNVDQLLQARPVQRGQALLTVGQLEGPWILELDVPDDHIEFVLDAQQQIKPDLEVTFILMSSPDVTLRGKVAKVALSAEPDPRRGPMVQVTVALDQAPPPHVRPGAGVMANIDCGERALGYVWFFDLYRSLRTRLFF